MVVYVGSPARVRVVLMGLSWSVQVMTVPFNMASGVTVTLRVDVKSNRDGLGVGMLETRMVVKIPRSVGNPKGTFSRYLISGLNAGLFHSRLNPPVTVHVRVTSSPGQIALWALEVSVTIPPAYDRHTVILRITHQVYLQWYKIMYCNSECVQWQPLMGSSQGVLKITSHHKLCDCFHPPPPSP